MGTKENLHAGHRERMISKLMNNPDSLLEHELMEILLFFSIPRIDVNALAHTLIRTFGSIENVFSATPSELASVKGVGKKTASFIAVVGKIYKRLGENKKPEKQKFMSFDKIKATVIKSFSGLYEEEFHVYFLDKDYVMLSKLTFSDRKFNNVEVDIPEIAHVIAILKPSFILLAHNHPSGNVNPSREDDLSTAKIYLLCSSHKVGLIDHIIVSGEKTYSYYKEKRLEHIKSTFLVENLL